MDSSNNPFSVPDVGEHPHSDFNPQAIQVTEYSDDIGVTFEEANQPLPHHANNLQLPVRPAVVPRSDLFRSLFMITFTIVQLDHPEASYLELWEHIVIKLLNTPLFATEADVIRTWDSVF